MCPLCRACLDRIDHKNTRKHQCLFPGRHWCWFLFGCAQKRGEDLWLLSSPGLHGHLLVARCCSQQAFDVYGPVFLLEQDVHLGELVIGQVFGPPADLLEGRIRDGERVQDDVRGAEAGFQFLDRPVETNLWIIWK